LGERREKANLMRDQGARRSHSASMAPTSNAEVALNWLLQ